MTDPDDETPAEASHFVLDVHNSVLGQTDTQPSAEPDSP